MTNTQVALLAAATLNAPHSHKFGGKVSHQDTLATAHAFTEWLDKQDTATAARHQEESAQADEKKLEDTPPTYCTECPPGECTRTHRD